MDRARWWRRIVVVVVVAAVASPGLRVRDSYPLSTYPVYATARDRTEVLATAVGMTADGATRRLSLPVIADTDDPLIAEDRVADAIRAGRADALCAAIAGRLAASPADQPTGSADPSERLVRVAVVEERVDLVDVAAGDDTPLERTTHATCGVGS